MCPICGWCGGGDGVVSIGGGVSGEDDDSDVDGCDGGIVDFVVLQRERECVAVSACNMLD
jgi:hypothetical protein